MQNGTTGFYKKSEPQAVDVLHYTRRVLSDIFRQAGLDKKLGAAVGRHEGEHVLRIINALYVGSSGLLLEHERADLVPEDRVRLSRAFRKSGCTASQYPTESIAHTNMPYIQIIPFIPKTDRDIVLVRSGMINPFRCIVRRPDADYYAEHAAALVQNLKHYFSRPGLIH